MGAAAGEGGRGQVHDQARAMDRMYRHTRHLYDLTRRPYLLGRDAMIARMPVPAGGLVLEMACGTGRNLVEIARRHPTAQLCGFDISAEMLKTARANVARAGLSERIRLAEGDATAFDPVAAFGVSAFDVVCVSYALSMIPDWRAAIREGLRLTRPEGGFACADFGDAAGLGAPLRRGLHGWLGLFHVTPRHDLEAELTALPPGPAAR
ncbi:class I SAM-dependent methyltransferase [Methylobrevis pamukkalensis]|uniref:Demethylmenaquinone methyltransferase n=1 Tax=Methylobrevis pamukkalensis TaxID=1439726 RepID=A0A1E3H503_9HYPH|nr:class I SAM-dependent methyltransferase [Methylobrevis pamukkalensis]ODN70856.1 Demethylmenaquinone methyltransferase [Methylobrevis pamukkalensis]